MISVNELRNMQFVRKEFLQQCQISEAKKENKADTSTSKTELRKLFCAYAETLRTYQP